MSAELIIALMLEAPFRLVRAFANGGLYPLDGGWTAR
jgi:hypothetical protein